MTWSYLPSEVGLRYDGGTSRPARRPGAGAVPGRRGACLAVRTPPAAFDSQRTDLRSVLLLLFQLQQLRGFRPEAAQLLTGRLVLVHPLHRPVVPFAGL